MIRLLTSVATRAERWPDHRGRAATVTHLSRHQRHRPVFVTVIDKDGRLVTTLAKEISGRDDGKPQPITVFDNSPQPIRLIVLLDIRGSMNGNLPLLRALDRSCSASSARTTSRASARSATTSRSARCSRATSPCSSGAADDQIPETRRRRCGARSRGDRRVQRHERAPRRAGAERRQGQRSDGFRKVLQPARQVERARATKTMVYGVGLQSRGAPRDGRHWRR